MPTVFEEESKEKTAEKSATGVVIARNGHNLAKPGEKWVKIRPGHLVVFKEGKVVYASRE